MRDTMGVIVTNDEKIPPLTDRRAIAAMPIAGRYRIIDFILSNMANAGIVNIGVATESNYSSLMDHIKSGSAWDLNRKNEGLKILPPNLAKLNYGTARGNLDMLGDIRDFITHSRQTYVILSLGNTINNIDFEEVLEAHIEKQADITMIYKDLNGADERELSRFNLVELDDEGWLTNMEVQPYYPKSALADVEIYIMEKALLESIIDESAAKGEHDFIKDAIIKKLSGMRIYGYLYEGYSDKIDSLKAYYRNCMMFLDESVRNELFNPERPIYTKTKDQAPTKYGEDAVVENCFVSDGCTVNGTVINSILSRGVRVAPGSIIRNSIIMQGSVIDEGVTLDHVVFDKEVHITRGRRLIGQASYPLAIGKRSKI